MTDVSVLAAVGSALISAIALMLSAHQLNLSRRAQEVEGVFQLWDRYERYTKDYADALKGSDEDRHRCIINMLNFLENSCLIFNRARAPSILKQNIKSLISDYVDMSEKIGSFIQVLDHYGTVHGAYDELRKFYKKYYRIPRLADAVTSPPAA